MTKKQYSSVSELLRDVMPDEEYQAECQAFIRSRKVIKRLMAMRAVRGLSQKDIAEKLGCTQSRISKIENGKDDDIRLGDLRAYAEAVECELIACVAPKDMKPIDLIKGHTFAIERHMDRLVQLAKADQKIVEGVADFFHELFVNFVLLMGKSAKKLPRRSDDSPYFDIRSDRSDSEEAEAPDPEGCDLCLLGPGTD